MNTPKSAAAQSTSVPDSPVTILKPEGDPLARFKSKRPNLLTGVETLLPPLAVYKIADAKDFVRLHHDESYWSAELCFISVPVVGQKRDIPHLIEEDLAVQYLDPKRILRHRLALASKPYNKFFLCIVPSQNLDNRWNETALAGCIEAKARWVIVTSAAVEGLEGYKIRYARDAAAFPDPEWPSQSLGDLIMLAFTGRTITDAENPGLLRMVGAEQRS
jgi:hypothetical protein